VNLSAQRRVCRRGAHLQFRSGSLSYRGHRLRVSARWMFSSSNPWLAERRDLARCRVLYLV